MSWCREDSGHVWVLDFGLVAHLQQDALLNVTAQSVAGTITYMAPEQAAGHAEAASDLYSMGVLLYQCLTGALPFRGSPMEVLKAKMERDPLPPRETAPQIPTELNTLCLALLARNAKLRPTTEAVLSVLTQSQESTQIHRADLGVHDFIFCGRKPELDVLRHAFATVANGESACVYVSGLSGIGKSTLVRRFLRDLVNERPDVVVLAGKCYELESVPFKAFDSLVDALGRWLRGLSFDAADALTPGHAGALARVFPVLSRVEAIAAASARETVTADEFELRRRAFGALRELLFRLGQRYRLVIVIDDLQWADADSISLLAFLFRLPNPPNLLFVGCYRTEESEVNPVLQELFSLRKKPEYLLAGEEAVLAADECGGHQVLGGPTVARGTTERGGRNTDRERGCRNTRAPPVCLLLSQRGHRRSRVCDQHHLRQVGALGRCDLESGEPVAGRNAADAAAGRNCRPAAS